MKKRLKRLQNSDIITFSGRGSTRAEKYGRTEGGGGESGGERRAGVCPPKVLFFFFFVTREDLRFFRCLRISILWRFSGDLAGFLCLDEGLYALRGDDAKYGHFRQFPAAGLDDG